MQGPKHAGHHECLDLTILIIWGATGGFSSMEKESDTHFLDILFWLLYGDTYLRWQS